MDILTVAGHATEDVSITSVVVTTVVATLSPAFLLAIYRLYFHPIARFPGPRLAAITYLYEWYFDICHQGQFTWKLKELHKKYGPIVRINPDELHINDPDYLNEIYNNSNGVTDKAFKYSNCFGPYPATFGTRYHHLHKIRRAALNPYFSRRSVQELLPYLQPILENLCQRFEDAADSEQTINLKYALSALTLDNMSEYCFSTRPNRIMKKDFDQAYIDGIEQLGDAGLLNYHLPWLVSPLFRVPDWLSRRISPALADTVNFREELSRQVEKIRSGQDKSFETAGHRTIFHSLLQSNLPPVELSRERMRDEAFSLVAAGSGTVSYTTKAIVYHVMANPTVHAKLVAALREVMPNRTDVPDNVRLEQIPYLHAIVCEGLRISHPVAHRLNRMFPEKTLTFKGHVIPPNTQVSMTALLVHENEDIFPEPQVFRPERWLGDGQKLSRYLFTFSRGSRACLGVNLAWSELYLIVAVFFRRFEFDLSQVDRKRDIDTVRDVLLGANELKSPGMLVKVKSMP